MAAQTAHRLINETNRGLARGGTTAELTLSRRAMACEFSITFPGSFPSAANAGYAALDEIDRLESRLSVFCAESQMSEVNRSGFAQPVTVDADVFAALRLAMELSRRTGGAFDAATGALVKAWGFCNGQRRVPSASEIIAALASSGSAHVRLDPERRQVRILRPGVEFNLGAIGKGFAIDRALQLVRHEYGTCSALLQGGQSSLRGLGTPSGQPRGWAVDIGAPWDTGLRVARVWLRNQALGTSSAGNQFFEAGGKRYGHILDPRSGWPARTLLSATVIAPTAAEADALSTAFFVLGRDGACHYARSHPGVSAVLSAPGRTAPEIVVVGDADVEILL